MRKIYYIGDKTNFTGWGILHSNLIFNLKKYFKVVNVCEDYKGHKNFDAPVIIPINESNLSLKQKFTCPKLIGITFMEWPIENSEENIKRFDWIFAGSEWCAEKFLKLTPKCSKLIQGIDFNLFKLKPHVEKEGFRVFSGGKIEYRKSQDIVLSAMRNFMEKHKDVTLTTAWANPYKRREEMIAGMNINPVDLFSSFDKNRISSFNHLVMPNELMPELYHNTDIGLFPNRCEGGTNLVMMEYMACGKPVIATNATGQKELLKEGTIPLNLGKYNQNGWINPKEEEILEKLEWAYSNQNKLSDMGLQCREIVKDFTWEKMAEEMAKKISE